MPDIAMCPGNDCIKKESCYRYKAKPDEYWQSYLVKCPVGYEDGNCELYMPLWETPMSNTSD